MIDRAKNQASNYKMLCQMQMDPETGMKAQQFHQMQNQHALPEI